LYFDSEKARVYQGDCSQGIPLPEATIDSLVCDPPAGINFMGHGWDANRGGRDAWVAWATSAFREALRLLKPGAHGLVWALPRRTHWTAWALENAGFDITNVVHHLFADGFPKNQDISVAIDQTLGAKRQVIGVKKNTYDGAHRDPSKHSNPAKDSSFGKWGLAKTPHGLPLTAPATSQAEQWDGWGTALKPAVEHWILVRKPIAEKTIARNVVVHGTGAINIAAARVPPGRWPANLIQDGEVEFPNARFFYAAKASKRERNHGCSASNAHPTVKPLALMNYLVRLITPPGGSVLDLFCGTGTTGIAAILNGFQFIGVENDERWIRVCRERIIAALAESRSNPRGSVGT
jgi:site-specific DNA-methyltransferase (adenine-specific)